jgi:hypothetical protein
MRISLIPMRQAWGYDTMIDAECSTVGEMTGFRHSRARLPPHPPAPFSHTGLKGGGFRAISGIGTGHRYAW